MEKGTGLAAFNAAYPRRFFDTGITEEHAACFAAGLAASGARPVFAVYSTFLQRAVDQVIHDIALQKLPVTFAIDRAGLGPGDGATHPGLFDLSLLLPVPNMTLLCPANTAELELMLRAAINGDSPAAIRYPKAEAAAGEAPPLEPGRGVWTHRGAWGQTGVFISVNVRALRAAQLPTIYASRTSQGNSFEAGVCIAYTGSLYAEVEAATRFLAEKGIAADAYNLRYLKPIDEDYLAEVIAGYRIFAVAEEGLERGGFGEWLTAFAAERAIQARIVRIAAPDKFFAQGTRQELLAECGLDGLGIANKVEKAYV
jgi:1-deoxy-D-xylulose-5-phosphate synthase